MNCSPRGAGNFERGRSRSAILFYTAREVGETQLCARKWRPSRSSASFLASQYIERSGRLSLPPTHHAARVRYQCLSPLSAHTHTHSNHIKSMLERYRTGIKCTDSNTNYTSSNKSKQTSTRTKFTSHTVQVHENAKRCGLKMQGYTHSDTHRKRQHSHQLRSILHLFLGDNKEIFNKMINVNSFIINRIFQFTLILDATGFSFVKTNAGKSCGNLWFVRIDKTNHLCVCVCVWCVLMCVCVMCV